MQKKLNILVTGGNRGIGYGLLQHLIKDPDFQIDNLLFTVRDNQKGKQTIQGLNSFIDKNSLASQTPTNIEFYVADISNQDQISEMIKNLKSQEKSVDLLIQNAAIYLKNQKVTPKTIKETLEVNFFGPKTLFELLEKSQVLSKNAHLAFVSSQLGKLSILNHNMQAKQILEQYREANFTLETLMTMVDKYSKESQIPETFPKWSCNPYSLSKLLLSIYIHQLARLYGNQYFFQSLCPGWCRTDMGTASAHKSVEQGVSDLLFSIKNYKKKEHNGLFVSSGQLSEL